MTSLEPRRVLGAAALALLACGGGDSPPVATDLASHLDLADLTAESSEVVPGDYDQRRELMTGWSPPRQDAEGAFATNEGLRSEISWRLAWTRPLELVLTGRSMTAANDESTTVAVSWNGQPLGALRLTADTETHDDRLEVPLEVQRIGANTILLDYSASGPSAATPPEVAWSRIRVEGTGVDVKPAAGADGSLRLPFRTAVDFYVMLPDGGSLTLDDIELYGPQGAWRNADPAPSLLISVHRYPAAPAAVSETITEERGRVRLRPHHLPIRVRIEPVAGARLPQAEAGFRFSGALHSGGNPWPHAASPAAAAPTAAASAPASDADSPGAKPPHVLIFLVDTLRADRLGCYGYDRPTSPNIDRFAAGAVRFEHAVAQSSWTRPSTASILTGLYPHNHGARSRNHVLARDVAYLPEALRSIGYRALGVSSNSIAGPTFGFRRGFSHFKQLPENLSSPGIHIPVWRVVNETLEWLERIGPEDSFFVFMHAMDPHAPYYPPEPHRSRFAPDAPAGALGKNMGKLQPFEIPHLSDLYDAEIAAVDEHFGRLLEELDRRGFLDDTLVVFVSDHGEEFQDHGNHGHGSNLYREQIHVPLIVQLPARLRAAIERSLVEEQVQQIDIAPTILEAIGRPGLIETDGRSLLPLMRSQGGREEHRVAMSDLRNDGEAVDALLLEQEDEPRRKLIDYWSASFGQTHQLFDTTNDPAELRNLRAREPHWAGYLRAVGRLMRRGSRQQLEPGLEPDMPPEQRRALEALGYLD
ncbi:MAG: sulfatase [Holophagales bacterium]|nr:sulfatase [Holophagales bacterium]MYI31680.1 sulfatase [Holophagales bacterium]